jgi:predicted nucleic acid-binding protein
MSGSESRVLVDTVFVQALLNKRDQYHAKALELLPSLRESIEVLVTEAVLLEVGNALCAINRQGAARWINACYETSNIRVVPLESALLKRAVQFYDTYSDQSWSLTDCVSFVVMRDANVRDALTADKHFIQAGFRALFLEEA